MVRPLLQLQLHEIGIERRERTIQRSAQILYHVMCCRDDPGTRIRVAQPCGQVSNKAVHAFNPLGTVDVVERGINLREIPDMWTVQNRCAQLGGLDGILTAVSDQRATDKHHWRQTIDKAKLANSVGDIDFCLVRWGNSPSERSVLASSRPRSRSRQYRGRAPDGAARSRSADPGKLRRNRACASITASSSPAWVDAAATTGRRAIAFACSASAVGSAGGAGTSSLRLPVTTTFGAPRSLSRVASDEVPARQRSRRWSKSAIELRRTTPTLGRNFSKDGH